MAKKRMTGEARRRQIVRVSTGLFVKKGFSGTTTREIARKAGISEAVIFRHFSRKEDLYRAIIGSRCDGSDGKSRLMGAIEGKKGRDVFREVASFLIREHQRDQTLMRLLTQSALERHDLAEVFIKTRGLELIEFLERQIKELVREGRLRKVDPKIAARAFMGMVLHFSLSQELYGLKRYFKWPNDRVVDTFVKIFFDGVTRR